MTVTVQELGHTKSRVVTVDQFYDAPEACIDMAAALRPFPASKTFYPGLRRLVSKDDPQAVEYVISVLEMASPYIGGVFECDHFDFIAASFSMVTQDPASLVAIQSAPHADSIDQNHLAIIHYLDRQAQGGTGFFRHRATGIERVTEDNRAQLVAAVQDENTKLGAPKGYINGSTERYEMIGSVAGSFNQLAIYQGSLLHSGLINQDFEFSDDPHKGRLTCNIFIKTK